jgi:hypothetical protein
MLIWFAIVDSTGGKTPSVRLANPPVPLAGFQAPLPGRFWVPADINIDLGLVAGITKVIGEPCCNSAIWAGMRHEYVLKRLFSRLWDPALRFAIFRPYFSGDSIVFVT